MDRKQQVEHFANDLNGLIERYRQEYDLTYADILAALQMRQWMLCQEIYGPKEKEG
jgi:hypothetical protein